MVGNLVSYEGVKGDQQSEAMKAKIGKLSLKVVAIHEDGAIGVTHKSLGSFVVRRPGTEFLKLERS